MAMRMLPLLLFIVLPLSPNRSLGEEKAEPEKEAKGERRVTKEEKELVARGLKLFYRAEKIGIDFLSDAKPNTPSEKLMECFAKEADVFNLIFVSSHRKKSKTYHTQHALRDDNEHLNIQQFARGCVSDGISITHGLTNSDKPILILRKFYQPSKGDKVHLGSELMVIIHAREKK